MAPKIPKQIRKALLRDRQYHAHDERPQRTQQAPGTPDTKSSITERDLRKILSAPIGKRDSNTNAVISQDILWEYLPRQHDGLTIDPFTASFILQDVADQALRQKLREIPGLVLSNMPGRALGGMLTVPTDMLCVFREKDSHFPTIYKIFPS
ncbi:Hypothetical protein PENO1_002040 [Penicillium occitanis (nom. inval.)]|nr:hypothetical protein PENOC_057250 [Penicillium occitanis (nom. inval.)]PCH09158.1 Hypothetical protein PENO1_002040 [Penicillium occitanis (nom. inval.)]